MPARLPALGNDRQGLSQENNREIGGGVEMRGPKGWVGVSKISDFIGCTGITTAPLKVRLSPARTTMRGMRVSESTWRNPAGAR